MYAHVHECTSRQVKCTENPYKLLQLRVIFNWAVHFLSEGRDVRGFNVAILGAFARVRRALGSVHILDCVNGLTCARDEQSKVIVMLSILRLIIIRDLAGAG